MKLNLGCGKDKKEGYVNADIIETDATDIVFDMNEFPYPFKDSSAEVIYLWSVLEHLKDLTPVMEELWRIGKNDCKLIIGVPHFSVWVQQLIQHISYSFHIIALIIIVKQDTLKRKRFLITIQMKQDLKCLIGKSFILQGLNY